MPFPRSQETDEYLSKIESPEARVSLTRLREIIHETYPEVQEVFSYGLPGFKLDGGPLIWFGAFKKHCSIFGAVSSAEIDDELRTYKLSKGTIQFPPDQLLPERLIRQILVARNQRNIEDAAAKKQKLAEKKAAKKLSK